MKKGRIMTWGSSTFVLRALLEFGCSHSVMVHNGRINTMSSARGRWRGGGGNTTDPTSHSLRGLRPWAQTIKIANQNAPTQRFTRINVLLTTCPDFAFVNRESPLIIERLFVFVPDLRSNIWFQKSSSKFFSQIQILFSYL